LFCRGGTSQSTPECSHFHGRVRGRRDQSTRRPRTGGRNRSPPRFVRVARAAAPGWGVNDRGRSKSAVRATLANAAEMARLRLVPLPPPRTLRGFVVRRIFAAIFLDHLPARIRPAGGEAVHRAGFAEHAHDGLRTCVAVAAVHPQKRSRACSGRRGSYGRGWLWSSA
jgi:hypothetical protein